MSGATTFRALCYLHAWDRQLPIQNGLAFESLLRACRLDYSVQSLQRIDVFLDALRKTGKLREDKYLDDPAAQNLLYLLAFYVGEVIGRALRSPPHWVAAGEEDPAGIGGELTGPTFDSSLVVAFPEHADARGKSGAPLVSICSRLFSEYVEKSVLFSAGFFLPPGASEPPASLQPLPPLLPQTLRTQWAGLPLDPNAPPVMGIVPPPWAAQDELRAVFEAAPVLLREGRVVWAALVQANTALLAPSALAGAPGEVLYDPQGRTPPAALQQVARLVFSFKGRSLHDPDSMRIAKYLADERIRAFGLDLPATVVPYPLKISSTWFDTYRLPASYLAQSVFPLLVSDAHPGVVLPLPGAQWPQAMVQAWAPAAALSAVAAPVSMPSPPRGYVAPADIAHLQPYSLVEEGLIYRRGGGGVAPDYAKAHSAWERAAQAGNAAGTNGLGTLYEEGLGVPRDLKRALEYFEAAARKGHASAPESANRVRLALGLPQLAEKRDVPRPSAKAPAPGLLGKLFGRS